MSQIQADVTMDTKLNSTDNNQMLIASQSPLPDTSHEGQTETEPSLHKTQNGRVTRAASVCSSISAEKHGSDSLPNALLPPSVARTEREASIRRPERLKTSTVNTEPDSDVLLACLFCQPLDCLLASLRGCNECIWSLCASTCGCDPMRLQPLLDVAHHCDLFGCVDARCCLCDCAVSGICRQTTECLDLAMEISQMLYH